ncbi:hypothetical protein TNCV_1084781 [Trichonephila clavipes]|nr:hypothetical protein TNCV_1084781 [Trichonephila clavipes]
MWPLSVAREETRDERESPHKSTSTSLLPSYSSHLKSQEVTMGSIHEVTDEAHFWLKGYVNKQNCRIWSKANPQVYVETPLHPEKLIVWCALWAGGILLQKR